MRRRSGASRNALMKVSGAAGIKDSQGQRLVPLAVSSDFINVWNSASPGSYCQICTRISY